MTSNLDKQVELALKNLSDSPWLPELTTELVARGWRDLYKDIKLTPLEYSTARAMVRNPKAPRRIVSFLPVVLDEVSTEPVIQIEILGEDFATHYERQGVKFYTTEELSIFHCIEQLREAINILKRVPTLFQTVALLIKSIHLIDADEDDYDVSFSEPQIPFSIFVSIPHSKSLINLLRITEAVVHEAMHLQLTLFERVLPLIIPSREKYFSPWKGEYRSPQDVLHALYVFRVIDRFLESLMLSSILPKDWEQYIFNRRRQIHLEIEQAKLLESCSELTPNGAKFVRGLLIG